MLPLRNQTNQLQDREAENSEHQMAHHLARPAHPHGAAAVVVFQSAIDPLGRAAFTATRAGGRTSSRRRSRTGRDRDAPAAAGFVLLIVLWVTALLALLGSQLLTAARHDARQARDRQEAAELDAAASGALQRAMFRVLDTSEARWDVNDTWRIVPIGGCRVAVRIEGEAARINPNFASEPLLRGLLLALGTDPVTAGGLAASIVEWRSADNGPDRSGPAQARYRGLGLEYAPGGGFFIHLDELGAVAGMTPDLLKRLKPHLSLFSGTGVDPSRRDPVVAAALRISGDGHKDDGLGTPVVLSIDVDATGHGTARLALRYVVRLNAQSRARAWTILRRERLEQTFW